MVAVVTVQECFLSWWNWLNKKCSIFLTVYLAWTIPPKMKEQPELSKDTHNLQPQNHNKSLLPLDRDVVIASAIEGWLMNFNWADTARVELDNGPIIFLAIRSASLGVLCLILVLWGAQVEKKWWKDKIADHSVVHRHCQHAQSNVAQSFNAHLRKFSVD